MNRTKLALCALGVIMMIAPVMSLTFAQPAGARQFYSSWSYAPQRGYHYRSYYFKPDTGYRGYDHHYCIFIPSQPRYVYYYNPVTHLYWGRYDLEQRSYSLLDVKDQKSKLAEIKDFPAPGPMPEIPNSSDGTRMIPMEKGDRPPAAE